MNMQIELRLNYFKGGSAEKFVTLFQTNFLIFEKNIDDERYNIFYFFWKFEEISLLLKW